MSSVLRLLGRPALVSLAQALEAGRLKPSVSNDQLRGQVPEELLGAVRDELKGMLVDDMAPRHIARLLRLLADERQAAQVVADRVELVWSGLDLETSTTRDTEIVVRQLFREAERSVLVASYAVDKGKKAEALFGHLAERLDEEPDLKVRFFLNVHRKSHKDETPESVLLREFADAFRSNIWPGERLPQVFHDPRSLAIGGKARACLHAKCVIADDDRALISSANFTEAAHERNIEAGVLIVDASLARALKAQFDTLVERGALKRVPGL